MRRLPSSARFLCGVGIPVLVLFTGCSVNPATGGRQLNLVSESQEIALGHQSDPPIVAQYGLYQDEELSVYVDDLGQRLAASSERAHLPWTFRVLDDPIVNAFALPGGYVYVTRGILAHLGSEAELAGVLGHEIGHITARHGASQMSKGLLAQAGLGVAAAVDVPLVNSALGLAESGIGLLFLKHGRDDERQADRLGVRYSLRADYDPRSLAEVFETLARVSEEASSERMPGWLSTHPSPGNRQELLDVEIAELRGGLPASLQVETGGYLRRLDGLVVGENPREGFFRNALYVHPDLGFSMEFPADWSGVNLKQAVSSMSPGNDAVIQLSPAQEPSASGAAEEFFSMSAVQRVATWDPPAGAATATSHAFRVNRSDGDDLSGLVTFVEHRGLVLRILSYTRAADYPRYVDDFSATSDSFSTSLRREDERVQPRRLRVVELDRDTTIAAWHRRTSPEVTTERLALLNGVEVDEVLRAGTLLKTVD